MKRKPMSRTTPIKKKNQRRQAKRKADGEVYGPYHQYVSRLPCAVMGEGDECMGVVAGHHLKSVGAGGKDEGNEVPLCHKHHQEWHTIGPKRFDAKYFNDLRLYAEILWRRYQEGE